MPNTLYTFTPHLAALFLLLLFFKILAVLGFHCSRQALCGGARASRCGAWTVLLQHQGLSHMESPCVSPWAH